MKQFILNLLFPKRCVNCGKLGEYICLRCFSLINPKPPTICPICAKLSVDGVTHEVCRKRWGMEGLVACVKFSGPARNLIYTLKFRKAFDVGKFILEKFILPAIIRNPAFEAFLFEEPTMVPIPLHQTRELERGYNQSAICGKLLSESKKLPFAKGLLVRTRETRPQTKLKKEAREKNIADAFRVNSVYKNTIPYHVLLFDDVWTTGATMRECAKLLKRAGVKEVWGLTIAR